jgi:predicted DNA-binding transcriptional regulator AlpA
LETEWAARLRELATAEAELTRREHQHPRALSPEQRQHIHALGSDLRQVWAAPTTTDRDRKELLRTLLEDVIIAVTRAESRAQLTLRWRGGTLTTIELSLPRSGPRGIRTDEETLALLPRLAAHYSDEVIAGILNKQGRVTATGERFTANQVGSLRRYRNIPRFQPPADPPVGDIVTIRRAAHLLGVVPSTIHRWINDGFIAGEQLTPGAPWRIRLTDELRARFVEEAPPDYLPMLETTMRLGVSRQTVLQRVKRGELQALHVRCGRRKGLRIKVMDTQPSLL